MKQGCQTGKTTKNQSRHNQAQAAVSSWLNMGYSEAASMSIKYKCPKEMILSSLFMTNFLFFLNKNKLRSEESTFIQSSSSSTFAMENICNSTI